MLCWISHSLPITLFVVKLNWWCVNFFLGSDAYTHSKFLHVSLCFPKKPSKALSGQDQLTHLGWNRMTGILQTTFSVAFLWKGRLHIVIPISLKFVKVWLKTIRISLRCPRIKQATNPNRSQGTFVCVYYRRSLYSPGKLSVIRKVFHVMMPS